jgi:hypothetical protein
MGSGWGHWPAEFAVGSAVAREVTDVELLANVAK